MSHSEINELLINAYVNQMIKSPDLLHMPKVYLPLVLCGFRKSLGFFGIDSKKAKTFSESYENLYYNFFLIT